MVENRNAITGWRDGFGEMAGRAALALRENWRNTDTFVVGRIMLEAAFRTDHDLALAWPASKMPPAKDTVQIAAPVLHVRAVTHHAASTDASCPRNGA
jgi:hypothetical protein